MILKINRNKQTKVCSERREGRDNAGLDETQGDNRHEKTRGRQQNNEII